MTPPPGDAISIRPLSADTVEDRLAACWGHLDDWKTAEVVVESRGWLEGLLEEGVQPSFVAADDAGDPVGIIEFVPGRRLESHGLVPCRLVRIPDEAPGESGESVARYLVDGVDECLFVTCITVARGWSGTGLSRRLLTHLLGSDVVGDYPRVAVYVPEREDAWDDGVNWPAGPRELYTDLGFEPVATLEDPPGEILAKDVIEIDRA